MIAEPVLSNIQDEWYRVRPALERLIAKNPGFDLTPDQVRLTCYDERAQLWVSPEGFVVTRFQDDEDNGIRSLLLWVSVSWGTDDKVPLHLYLPFFDGVAKYMNCKYIELYSSREGMERYLAKHDFAPLCKVFRKQVDG